jgi:hypothetical protein
MGVGGAAWASDSKRRHQRLISRAMKNGFEVLHKFPWARNAVAMLPGSRRDTAQHCSDEVSHETERSPLSRITLRTKLWLASLMRLLQPLEPSTGRGVVYFTTLSVSRPYSRYYQGKTEENTDNPQSGQPVSRPSVGRHHYSNLLWVRQWSRGNDTLFKPIHPPTPTPQRKKFC